MLDLFAIFHLNLAYSSIEEAERPAVVDRCYWPLLRLVERVRAPIGIEASGLTLETAASLDSSWLSTLRRLLAEHRCEFLGSGYSQIIAPLVPADVNAANLRLGHEAYERLLGFRPRVAFVNEQAYSAGLIRHYLNASYDAIVMEWDNPGRAHPEWNSEWRYFPQIAVGQHGESIPIIWNKAIAFQQFQRYAHDESSLGEYLGYLAGHVSSGRRVFPIYGNDAEIFDFRPGRYHTEAALGTGEWARIEQLFARLAEDERFRLIRPSQALELLDEPLASHRLRLESPEDPTPVKKQRKYNITRWAVTGRDDIGINTACWRIYQRLGGRGGAGTAGRSRTTAESQSSGAQVAAVEHRDVVKNDWRELCELWSSDYRTHITDARWEAYRRRLSARTAQVDAPPAPIISLPRGADPAVARDGSLLTLRTDGVTVVLNCRRGLVLEALSFPAVGPDPLCGTLKHGFYDDIHWGADFYTGMTVMESPGRPKVTDLNRVDPQVGRADGGDLVAMAVVPTELGAVVKTVRVAASCVELVYRLEWPAIPLGSLRLGDITLNPRAFDRAALFYRCHNGGFDAETFQLDGTHCSHGDAVSSLVSASHAVGITEGMVELGDRRTTLRIDVDKTAAAVVGMVTYQPVRDTYFCRVSFSVAEADETRRAITSGLSPLVCRFVLSARRE